MPTLTFRFLAYFKLLNRFPKNATAKKNARDMGISSKLFEQIAPQFVAHVQKHKESRLDPLLIKKLTEEEGAGKRWHCLKANNTSPH